MPTQLGNSSVVAIRSLSICEANAAMDEAMTFDFKSAPTLSVSSSEVNWTSTPFCLSMLTATSPSSTSCAAAVRPSRTMNSGGRFT